MRDTSHTDESQRYMRGIQLPDTSGRSGASGRGNGDAGRRGRDDVDRRDGSRDGRPRREAPLERELPPRRGSARRGPSGDRPSSPSRRGPRQSRPAPRRNRPAMPPRLPLSPALLAVLAVIVIVLGSSYLFRPQDSTETVPVNTGTQETGTQGADPQETEPEGSDEPQNMSTPQSEWRQGVMPYLYQTDPQYADAPYSNGTFAKQGCGPTALATVYIYLTGDTSMGPLEMAEFSTENGFSTDGNGSSWTLMSDGAAMLGLSSETLPAVPARLAEALESGHPLICVMAPGTFTEVGHYITIERLDADGKAVVHDSNSVERSSQTWDLELICSEAVNIWSFSIA